MQESEKRASRLSGRPEAAAAIWDWRGQAGEEDAGPSASSLRLKAIIQSVVGFTVGTLMLLFVSRTIGLIALGLASLVLLAGLLSPRGLYLGIQRLFESTGNVVGKGMTWIIMVPLFYLFFAPFGLLMRRGRRDQLKCYYEPEATSYWEPHKTLTAESREHQF